MRCMVRLHHFSASFGHTDCGLTHEDLHSAPLDDKYIWPLLHPNLKALPRVYMNACGADTLRDDARLMKELLDSNGCVMIFMYFLYSEN